MPLAKGVAITFSLVTRSLGSKAPRTGTHEGWAPSFHCQLMYGSWRLGYGRLRFGVKFSNVAAFVFIRDRGSRFDLLERLGSGFTPSSSFAVDRDVTPILINEWRYLGVPK